MTAYFLIGTLFATATFYFGGKVQQDEPVSFMAWLAGYIALIFTWPIALLFFLYLAVDGKSE